MVFDSAITNIIRSLEENHLLINELIDNILHSTNEHHLVAHRSIEDDMGNICRHLYANCMSWLVVFDWAMDTVSKVVFEELQELVHECSGLHFCPTAATVEQLEGGFLSRIAGIMQAVAPHPQ
ncbi:hypothetical protein EDB19DRAFT_1643506 [Suillus lakei]|nr:hypothetical protein EDB19DRAFT_1643506 [Suillus lakei]